MTTLGLNLFNAGQLVDSVTSCVADHIKAREKLKQPQNQTFSFGGVEYTAAPKPRNTLIPTPRIG